MNKKHTLAGIITNALNTDYTADQAVADLEKLMNEATLVELQHGTESSHFIELKELISVQEKLVQAKLDGHPIFDQLGNLKATLHEDE